jgi:cysteine sulfinate desulfinase/cysteine desulfurase-like protein
VGRSRRLRTQLLAQLSVEFPDMIVNTNPLPKSKEENVASNIVNISFPKIDTDYTVMLLSKAGYAVSTKSACETDSAGSRVVLTLTGNAEQALSTLRISWGPTTSSRSLTTFLKQLIKTIAFQKTS